MLARLSAFVIWALVAATAVFWGLRLIVRATAAPVYAVAVGDATAAHGDLSRLLGTAPVAALAAAPAPVVTSRFRLLGVVAPKRSSGSVGSHGVALIVVDGKMPRAYAIGSRLDGDLVLQSVSLRTASIGPAGGSPAITLELPPLTAAATGTLPIGGAAGGTSLNGGIGPYAAPSAVTPPQAVPQFAPQPGVPTAVPQQFGVPQSALPLSPQPPPLIPRSEANAPTQ